MLRTAGSMGRELSTKSSDKYSHGSAAIARHAGVPSLVLLLFLHPARLRAAGAAAQSQPSSVRRTVLPDRLGQSSHNIAIRPDATICRATGHDAAMRITFVRVASIRGASVAARRWRCLAGRPVRARPFVAPSSAASPYAQRVQSLHPQRGYQPQVHQPRSSAAMSIHR